MRIVYENAASKNGVQVVYLLLHWQMTPGLTAVLAAACCVSAAAAACNTHAVSVLGSLVRPCR